jgi:hypothetical protein
MHAVYAGMVRGCSDWSVMLLLALEHPAGPRVVAMEKRTCHEHLVPGCLTFRLTSFQSRDGLG